MGMTLGLILAGLVVQQAPASGATAPVVRSGSISNSDYPRSAVRARAQGDVLIRFTVTTEGRVTDCRPESSSGSVALDEQACNIWVRRTRYRPATDASGQPVAQSATQAFSWRIDRPCPRGEPGRVCITASRPQPLRSN